MKMYQMLNSTIPELPPERQCTVSYGSPGRLAVIILSVIIPGLVILTCIIASIFLCWHRDRILIFRSRAQKYASHAAKTLVPRAKGGGYPSQKMELRMSASAEEGLSSMEEDEVEIPKEDEKKSKPADEKDVVIAVDARETSHSRTVLLRENYKNV